MREFIALLRECLSGAKVAFAGDYYQVRGFRLGVELGVAAADLAGRQGGNRPAGMTLHQIPQALLSLARLDFLQADQRRRPRRAA
jgi:alkanesulfonate monooxygenase SsuD/methylene tetrahydromethanopterin reductase-like flavin-dependent oxidoreductase (luciferase family)